MKWLRFSEQDGHVRPGLYQNNQVYDLADFLHHDSPIEQWQALAQQPFDKLLTKPVGALTDVNIAPCIARPGKIICVGANSKEHNRQLGLAKAQPIFFFKPASALSGAFDPIPFGALCHQLDWEGELGIVIGRQGRHIGLDQALNHVAGYCTFNDLSDRYWQTENNQIALGGQLAMAKCFDGYAPIGPWITTADEIKDPTQLNVETRINGELRQSFSTSDYIDDPAQCIHKLSQFMTLYPGDVITMGSGPGNAAAWQNQYLKPGDVVELSISQLGKQHQRVVREQICSDPLSFSSAQH